MIESVNILSNYAVLYKLLKYRYMSLLTFSVCMHVSLFTCRWDDTGRFLVVKRLREKLSVSNKDEVYND